MDSCTIDRKFLPNVSSYEMFLVVARVFAIGLTPHTNFESGRRYFQSQDPAAQLPLAEIRGILLYDFSL